MNEQEKADALKFLSDLPPRKYQTSQCIILNNEGLTIYYRTPDGVEEERVFEYDVETRKEKENDYIEAIQNGHIRPLDPDCYQEVTKTIVVTNETSGAD